MWCSVQMVNDTVTITKITDLNLNKSLKRGIDTLKNYISHSYFNIKRKEDVYLKKNHFL
jgi:hypothetical protein